MDIKLNHVTVRDLCAGYVDNDEEGVVGYDGRLVIRPEYQRAFVYKNEQRNEVIRTIRKDRPLNIMYWAKTGEDTYEVLDGQQRIISICSYIDGQYSVDGMYYSNLTGTEKNQILDYKLMVYFCDGNHREKLDWFETVNIAGERLFDQELRNAIYAGPWVSSGRRYFSQRNGPAKNKGGKYLNGNPIRQDYLETVIKWASNGNIENFMAENQHEENAESLWKYFVSVVDWIEATFPVYDKSMRGVDWGRLHREYKDEKVNPARFTEEVQRLLENDDVQKHSGIYEYLLSGNEQHLNLRTFNKNVRSRKYHQQDGKCARCKNHFDLSEMDADHILPWKNGGLTEEENCQMLCIACNRGGR